MTALVLVAYATRYGSTQGVAEAVAATLREQGLAADVRPAREVSSLGGYGAVVLGAPLYIGSWPKDAVKFLARHQAALSALPVAVFALGPISEGEPAHQAGRAELDKVLAKTPWLAPAAVEVFAGKYDPAKLRFPYTLLNLMPANPLKGMPARDLRDWDAIRAWAQRLPAVLKLETAEN